MCLSMLALETVLLVGEVLVHLRMPGTATPDTLSMPSNR